MSLISSLPYDIIFLVEDHLSTNDLQTLIKVFFNFHDKSILFITYAKLSEKKIVISDTLRNELIYGKDSVFLDPTICFQFLQEIIMYNELYGTDLFPKSLVFDLNLTNEEVYIDFHRQMFDFLKNERYNKQFIHARFDLIFRSKNEFSTKEVSNFLRGLAGGIGPQTREIKVLGSIVNIDLSYVETLFSNLKCLNLNTMHHCYKLEYVPLSVEMCVLNGIQLSGKKLSNKIKSLNVKNSTFNNYLSLNLPLMDDLTLCNISNISGFVVQNWSSTLVSLELNNVELRFDNLKFRELYKLERLKLINIFNESGYQFQSPPLLQLLLIQDKYIPLLSTDFQNLPETLISLTLRADLPFKFDTIPFPRNLSTLVLQGGGGIFQCEKFKCPPILQKLIITLQEFRNVHKFRLAKTLTEVNLSSNKIKKISTMKFPPNIVSLCLSNNNFSNIKGVQFPARMKQIDLTQRYCLTGEFDFSKYYWLSKANIFISNSNNFVFNNQVKIINDYDWRVDRGWKNRDIEYFY